MTSATKFHHRIELIDVLRGFTLLGIILVHFTEQYYAGNPPQKAVNYNAHFLGDQIAQTVVFMFITGKFYMIFSLLFGLSFFIQFAKSDGSAKFYGRFIWRLIILFAIGWLHTLHYRGDILTIYAILGIGLLVFHKLPDRILLIVAIALTINVPSVMVRGVEAWQAISSGTKHADPFASDDQANEKYFDTIKAGNYTKILKANIPEFKGKMEIQVLSGRLYITLGLFLLGLYIGRKRLFENIEDHLLHLKKLRNRALWLILGLFVFAGVFFGGAQLLNKPVPAEIAFAAGGFLYDLLNAAMALFYVCVIVLLFQKEKWATRLHHFYPVGRMGLTTYLMQTVFGVLIFFGFGLNLLNEVGALACLGIALVLFVCQIIFSAWWLARYNFGPVEWLWRSLTYLRWQPFKK